jgi:hypothetical protein
MFGALQISVRWKEKALEVPQKNIIDRKESVKE